MRQRQARAAGRAHDVAVLGFIESTTVSMLMSYLWYHRERFGIKDDAGLPPALRASRDAIAAGASDVIRTDIVSAWLRSALRCSGNLKECSWGTGGFVCDDARPCRSRRLQDKSGAER